jgi:hypothetical protein
MPDLEALSEREINWRAMLIRDGTGTPTDAQQLVSTCVAQLAQRKLSPAMMGYLEDAFRVFLTGERRLTPGTGIGAGAPKFVTIRTMDQALGLVRSKAGAPRVPYDTSVEVAFEVWVRRLAGDSLEDACATVASSRKDRGLAVNNERTVQDAWVRYKPHGFMLLKHKRRLQGNDLTANEVALVKKIIADDHRFEGMIFFPEQYS